VDGSVTRRVIAATRSRINAETKAMRFIAEKSVLQILDLLREIASHLP
jgi:hypothetical protein